jgi:hypothetical protein
MLMFASAAGLTPGAFAATNRPMPNVLPPCPHLPAFHAGLDWRALHRFREDERGEAFYFACLEYGQTLWSRGLAARSLLCLDRALGADLRGGEPVLRDWPLPYAAMAWLIAQTPPEVFIGNPRVHFQHYAGRMNAPRREQRRWRAWACICGLTAMQPARDASICACSLGLLRKLKSWGPASSSEVIAWISRLGSACSS